MASSASRGSSGRPHQDFEASLSSKLFNSGRTLGSFLDVGDNSDSSAKAPIDTEEDAIQSRGLPPSTVRNIALSDSVDAKTPRRVDGNDESAYEETRMDYPPATTTPVKSISSFVPSKHPQLLPHHVNLDPSSSAGGTSNNSSGQSSFDYGSSRQDRLSVGYPNTSNTSSQGNTSSRTSNGGLAQQSNHVQYNTDTSNTSNDNNRTFDKVSGGKQHMQIFGTPPVGIIGVHKPREIIRLDRDYTSGEICQFWSGFPLELEGRITATQHLNAMNKLNAILASAFDPYKAIFDNVIAVLSLYLSTWFLSSHYDKEIARFDEALNEVNKTLYNPSGLNLINPKKNGYLFLEVEYY